MAERLLENVASMNQVSTAEVSESIPSSAPQLDSVRILVVEDDERCREALTMALEGHGAIVVAVDSVQAALERFEREAPALLISDIEMPERDGFDLIREVRARDASYRHTPAIAVTGLAINGGRDVLRSAGFDDLVAKPIDLAFLVERIRALVAC